MKIRNQRHFSQNNFSFFLCPLAGPLRYSGFGALSKYFPPVSQSDLKNPQRLKTTVMRAAKPKKFVDAVVVGNVGIDTNIYHPERDIDFEVEANFTENLDCVGQAGGYSCRGFARLGLSTAFIGFVGDDFMGRFILEEFARDSIDTRAVFIDPAGTSRSVNFMNQDGRRKNFYDGKSHMTLQPDLTVCTEVLHRCRLVHFNLPNWARSLLSSAKASGAVVSVDLQDMTAIDDPYRQDFMDTADILFFSAINFPDPVPTLEYLLAKRPNQIIIAGMGERGCALGTKDGIRLFDAIPTGPPVVDTNGAGDALAVGFLASYVLDDYNFSDAVRRGHIAAKHACTQKADSSKLITRAELAVRFEQTV